MKAWRIESHGGPEVLKRMEIPLPVPGPNEARIRVQAVGINHLDLWVRKGVAGHKFPLPITPGCDIVGVIDQMGQQTVFSSTAHPEIPVLKPGTPVIVNPGTSCGICEACLSGFDPLCRFYGIFGETQDGGCADYVIAPLQNLIHRPPSLSVTDAAALPIPFLTAWTMLFRKAKIQPGELVLIRAAGSGVSVAAIQMAKMVGANVITTIRTDDKLDKAKSLGADFVINTKTQDFKTELKTIAKAFGKTGCDVVLDHTGAENFSESLKALSWGGRYVTCGATSGGEAKIDLKAVFFKNISVLGSTMGSKADFIRIVQLAAEGKLKPIVDSVHTMNDLPAAHARLESRQAFGKVILTAGSGT